MSKMEIMNAVKIMLKILGLIPFGIEQLNDSKCRSYLNSMYKSVVFASNFTFIASSGWFFFFKAKTFNDFSESVIFFSGSILSGIIYAVLLQKRTKLIAIIRNLEEIIERRSVEPAIRNIYETTNEQADKWPKIIFMMVFKVCVPLFIIPEVILSYYFYYTQSKSHPFHLVYLAAFPWNWETPFGYFLSISIQFLNVFYCVAAVQFPAVYYMEICTFLGCFIWDMEKHFQDFNSSIVETSEKLSPRQRVMAQAKFCDIMRFDAEVRHFVSNLLDVYRVIITIYIGFFTTFLCSYLLSLNAALDEVNIIYLVRIIVCLSTAVGWVFIFCNFGDEVTSRYLDIYNSIYQCYWYEFPLEIQQLISLAILVSQQPTYFTGHMNIRCTREFYKKIINTVFSYFTILRKFSH